jgi:hypothetical protein
VQVLLDGEPAVKIGLVLIDIENTGNEPIRPEEFVKPLVFEFTANTRVISAEVTRTKPENLGATVSLDTSSVTVAPLLMNSGDEMSIKVLLRQFDGKVRGDARIVGIREVKRRFENVGLEVARTSTWLSFITALVASVVSGFSVESVKGVFPNVTINAALKVLETVVLPLLAVVVGYYFGKVREFRKPDKDESEPSGAPDDV